MTTHYDLKKKYLSTCKSVNYLYFPDSVRPGFRDFPQYDKPTTNRPPLMDKRETLKTQDPVITICSYFIVFVKKNFFAVNNYFSLKLKGLCYAEVGTFVIILPYNWLNCL